jgi:hypothetical protein
VKMMTILQNPKFEAAEVSLTEEGQVGISRELALGKQLFRPSLLFNTDMQQSACRFAATVACWLTRR